MAEFAANDHRTTGYQPESQSRPRLCHLKRSRGKEEEEEQMPPPSAVSWFAASTLLGSHILRERTKPTAGYFLLKRLIDIVIALLLLMLVWPVMAIVAVLIAVDSPGPVLFCQKRVRSVQRRREDGQVWQPTTFTFYKFRSMVHNSDSKIHRDFVRAFIQGDRGGLGALQPADADARKLVRDPRVTRVGRFIRKYSLDELPQLWNVVKGDMSLVGPRPPLEYELEDYSDRHMRRFEGRPGLTGLWQVTARSSADFEDMVRLDIWYIDHRSLWLDLVILVKTPVAVLSCKGAL
jgi:lipopolysaccharide/colanic/teichoic acid biosynthesis glycosyltransferase